MKKTTTLKIIDKIPATNFQVFIFPLPFFFVSILMLAGGIVSIAVRNSQKNGGNIAIIILFLLASLLGLGLAGNFGDLNIWAGWCLINAVLAIISIFKQNKGVQQ